MKFKKGVVARILIYAIIISGLFIDISCKKTTSSKLQFEISFFFRSPFRTCNGPCVRHDFKK